MLDAVSKANGAAAALERETGVQLHVRGNEVTLEGGEAALGGADQSVEEEFFADWCRLQNERFLDVARLFAPLPVLSAPLAEDEVCGVEALRAHGERIFGDISPDARLCNAPRVQFLREGSEYIAIVPTSSRSTMKSASRPDRVADRSSCRAASSRCR